MREAEVSDLHATKITNMADLKKMLKESWDFTIKRLLHYILHQFICMFPSYILLL